MARRRRSGTAAAIGAFVLAWAFADSVATGQQGPTAEQRIRAMDRNRDGRVSREQFRGPPPAFGRIDRNADGYLTAAELGAFLQSRQRRRPDVQERVPAARAEPLGVPVIDTHLHVLPTRFRGQSGEWASGARAAVAAMDRLGIRTAIIMSPPLPSSRAGMFGAQHLLTIARQFPGRFAVMAGGSTLNPMIDGASDSGAVDADLRQRFQATAERLLQQGAVGFGEMTALHFSFNSRHPFEETPPDHPLFLLLADIAARHGVPIDFHMEAVVTDFNVPQWLMGRSANNPRQVRRNIAAFERLLAHNRGAKIVWAHAGMDTTHQRSPELMRQLFRRHPNLYASIKVATIPQTPNWVARRGAGLNPRWRRVMVEFPDRFVIGTDAFYQAGQLRRTPQSSELALEVLKHLPRQVARKVAHLNAQALYRVTLN